VQVISIVPAANKESTVLDWGYRIEAISASRLATLLRSAQSRPSTFVCWPTPLTGPYGPDDTAPWLESDHNQRPIETFFKVKKHSEKGEFKTPKGISVAAYASCPQWALSRRLLGLPRVGPYDQREELPFRLVASKDDIKEPGPYVAEVHPALAVWLWCRGVLPASQSWAYRNNADLLYLFWKTIAQRLALKQLSSENREAFNRVEPTSGEQLDVLVAGLLGQLWSHDVRGPDGKPLVVLLGNRSLGALLLPNTTGLERGFAKYADTIKRHVAAARAEA